MAECMDQPTRAAEAGETKDDWGSERENSGRRDVRVRAPVASATVNGEGTRTAD